jgi:hypothetical protein
MSTVSVTNLKNAASASNNLVLDTSGNTTAAGTVAMGSSFLRNRIINGAMVIDQRNAGAAINSAPDGTWVTDRFICYHNIATVNVGQNLNSVTPPAGFTNYLGIQVTGTATAGASQYTNFQHYVEGFNMADLAWGTASASPITMSFWVRSSLTGTQGLAVQNSASNYGYPFTVTINAANTWEYKTVTIPGPTSGTWNTTNGRGITLVVDLGMGSDFRFAAGSWQVGNVQGVTGALNLNQNSNATFYITGVQLEIGTVATPFERRLYGTELMLCQRYYEKSYDSSVVPGSSSSNGYSSMVNTNTGSTLYVFNTDRFAAVKRASPTMRFWDLAGNLNRLTNYTLGGLSRSDNNNSAYSYTGYQTSAVMINTQAASFAATYQWDASAEL